MVNSFIPSNWPMIWTCYPLQEIATRCENLGTFLQYHITFCKIRLRNDLDDHCATVFWLLTLFWYKARETSNVQIAYINLRGDIANSGAIASQIQWVSFASIFLCWLKVVLAKVFFSTQPKLLFFALISLSRHAC